jgi:hypothetical protein
LQTDYADLKCQRRQSSSHHCPSCSSDGSDKDDDADSASNDDDIWSSLKRQLYKYYPIDDENGYDFDSDSSSLSNIIDNSSNSTSNVVSTINETNYDNQCCNQTDVAVHSPLDFMPHHSRLNLWVIILLINHNSKVTLRITLFAICARKKVIIVAMKMKLVVNEK